MTKPKSAGTDMREEIFPFAGQVVYVKRKRIKNMYLRVQKPDGRIEVTAPLRMKREAVTDFLAKHWQWVGKKQQAMREKLTSQNLTRQYQTGDKVPLWGQYYDLVVRDSASRQASVFCKETRIILTVPSYATVEQRREIVNGLYRRQLEQAIPKLLPRCEAIVGKKAAECRIRNMKTRWGTCNIVKTRVWLNLQLAKYKPEALEYVMLHELTHLWVANHGPAFKARMDKYCPDWRRIRQELNKRADFA
ncbi:M48 family metallopeptidase [Selenomonas ruminis]|uniref:M48 family metallopeptidase n=1 Tax=Selenomonas ruminis TaxID=2593411 RepID=UPI001655EBB7|nr:SprT family zinc-dependent metalloprotease [Selenomonas sp. mPRGC5]